MQIQTQGTGIRRFPGRKMAVRVFCLATLCALSVNPLARAGEDPRLESSRQYAAALQAGLGTRLKSALSAGGTVAAIEVCQLEAPLMAVELATGGPARIGRTALRVRNPANAADEAARRVLEQFTQELKAAAPLPPEYFTATEDGGARYMQAIPTQPMCLACHGSELADDVRLAIGQYYPEDQATGFAIGDLRGAFIIDWPAR